MRRPPFPSAGDGQNILEEAECLGIPWREVLSSEILAEKTLRDSVEKPDGDLPLSCLFSLLPHSLLQSWRARQRIHDLSWEARAERPRAAANRLRSVFLHLAGRHAPEAPFDSLLASHLGFAYERVLQLQRIGKAAEKSKGTLEERIQAVAARTHCSDSDAAWAVERADSRRRSDRLVDAMRRAREEGFELPVAKSEALAFARLKRFIERRPYLLARRRRARSEPGATAPESPSRRAHPWTLSPPMAPLFPESESPDQRERRVSGIPARDTREKPGILPSPSNDSDDSSVTS